ISLCRRWTASNSWKSCAAGPTGKQFPSSWSPPRIWTMKIAGDSAAEWPGFCTRARYRAKNCWSGFVRRFAVTSRVRGGRPRRCAVAKVVIVEDDEMLMDLMQQTLELNEYTTRGAGTGEEGLAKAEAEKPDIILMDIGMPVMDGYEATRRLKSNADTKNIPVIALTAHASPTDRQRALDAGADDYEPKPVNFDRLQAKM